MRDVKEVVGALMRVIGGGEVSPADVEELSFDAEGAMQAALNEAYIKLLEFAYDRDARLKDPSYDRDMRFELQHALDEIVRCSDGLPDRSRSG